MRYRQAPQAFTDTRHHQEKEAEGESEGGQVRPCAPEPGPARHQQRPRQSEQGQDAERMSCVESARTRKAESRDHRQNQASNVNATRASLRLYRSKPDETINARCKRDQADSGVRDAQRGKRVNHVWERPYMKFWDQQDISLAVAKRTARLRGGGEVFPL